MIRIDRPDHQFQLCDVEVETPRRSAMERNLPFDPKRKTDLSEGLDEYWDQDVRKHSWNAMPPRSSFDLNFGRIILILSSANTMPPRYINRLQLFAADADS